MAQRECAAGAWKSGILGSWALAAARQDSRSPGSQSGNLGIWEPRGGSAQVSRIPDSQDASARPRGVTACHSIDKVAIRVPLKRRNPHFGCVRIAQQITRAFGVEIDKDVARRVLAKHCRPGDTGTTGPSWLTLIAQAKDSLWSVDLFRCESIFLHSHWVLVVIDIFTCRIIGFGIERGSIDGVSICRMFNHAVAGQPPPKHVSTDHDPLFRFHRWRANLRVREIEKVKSVPYAPASHPFVERLIGTIRREYLDRVFFWNAVDLARKLEAFRDYYNGHRVHRAIAGLTPAQRAGALRPLPLHWITTVGSSTAGACSNFRSPPD